MRTDQMNEHLQQDRALLDELKQFIAESVAVEAILEFKNSIKVSLGWGVLELKEEASKPEIYIRLQGKAHQRVQFPVYSDLVQIITPEDGDTPQIILSADSDPRYRFG